MSEDTTIKLQHFFDICRICLKQDEEKRLSLFESYRDQFVYTYIHILTEVRIDKDDGYPNQICKHCLLDLETAISFKEKCESSNKKLHALVNWSISKDVKEESFQVEGSLIKKEFLNDDLSDAEDNVENLTLDIAGCQNDSKENLKLKQVQCHDCGEYFDSKCKLRVHWKKIHYAQSCLKVCARCKLSFKTRHAYHNHLKNVTKRCKALGDELINIEGYGKNRIFNCKECNYKTISLPNIINHCAKHSGKTLYQCKLCQKGFIQYASWSKHMEFTHKQYKEIITCHHCGKLIKGSGSFKRHLKSHSDIRKFQCDICKKMYKTKCTLQNHMNTHKDKNFTCEICAKIFHTASGLWIHIQYVHKKYNRKLFKCGICEYKSMKLYTVKKHEQKHTDSNVACPQCGKFFEKADKMLKHQRIHFEVKKFECTQCERKYLLLDSLHKHQKIAHRMQFS